MSKAKRDLTKTFVIDITEDQQEILHPYLSSLKPGETMIAQVYGDGLRIKKLSAPETLSIIASLLGRATDAPISNSAYESHELAQKRGVH